jgi:hypothetical protein
MKLRTWKILQFACALLLGAAGAGAATFTVNTTNDTSDIDLGDGICADINGKCSVRAAIMQANFTNAIGISNTIIIPAGVYTLTRPGNDDGAILGDLDIAQSMTLQGAGSSLTIIDGNGAVTGDRVFQILSSARDTSLSGLTIRNGMRTNTFDEGGGLYWDGGGGHLHLDDVVFESNSAYYGGGVYLNFSATSDLVEVDMDHVLVRNNAATAAAGGGLTVVFPNSDAVVVFDLRNSEVYSNTAFQGGGAYFQGTPSTFGTLSVRIETTQIYSNKAAHGGGLDNASGNSNFPVNLLNCRLYKNSSDSLGGGIENSGTLVLSGTTVDGNSAVTQGGGIYNDSAAMTSMTNSTISGNSVTSGSGGGIYNDIFLTYAGTINLLNCTIASNSAPSGFGGGITNQNGTVNARGTIIANNTAGGGPDFAGTLASTGSGYDLFGNSSGLHFSGSPPFGCVFNVNPLLGPLRDNGGPTFTHALLVGSPAIDAGRSIGLTTDQRGAPRPVDDPAIANANPGDGSDIGAFEVGKPPQLAIQKAASAAVLSWPSYYGGFDVQSVTNLSLSNAWTNESGTPVVSGDRYVFTNGPISGNRFYRLKGN